MLEWDFIDQKYMTKIEDFQCSDEPSVRAFLQEEALSFHNLGIAKTKLFFDDEDNLVGYFTLYNDMMTIGRKKRRRHNLNELPSYKYYPAIKLHYMGVDQRFRNRGFGAYLLSSAMVAAKEVSEQSGCLFLTVESLKSAIGFYYKYEFNKLNVNGSYLNMFLKLNEL
ncbi:GNAT family N-acetyltransferase [Cohnella hashimotonis]|uniref:GNAT family N-acetyltransferase n=1 Tax=Cohnella hashimotonis TaxID=2826895 RepID=A0ABT6TBA4_9BACL|nr:GNAT family N-acetyltransferase [Cohnella hashimotonis]MDI4643600.1 GNAT family N-acetyltransferase [Cohnella hashimotonis]